jgi:hypothetical protein
MRPSMPCEAEPLSCVWYDGREAVRATLASNPLAPGASRHIHVPTRANRQPTFVFVAGADDALPRPIGLAVLGLVDGLIVEIDVFMQPKLVERFAITPPR